MDHSKYQINLAGIGLSFVDFKPNELCYIVFDQITMNTETLYTKRGFLEKTFKDLELKIRNFQVDAMQNEVFPVLLGPKTPFRNIERSFQRSKLLDEKIVAADLRSNMI